MVVQLADVRTIAALVTTPALRAQLEAALRPPGAPATALIRWCHSPLELYAAVAEGGVALAITEWIDGTIPIEAAVRRLRQEFPTVPVLVYTPLTPSGARAALAAGSVGVRDLILAGHDDVGRAVHAVLARATDASLASYAVARLSGLLSVDVLAILTYVLRNARGAPTVAHVARALHVHRKTLAEKCRRAGAPPPSELVSWGRLVIASARLADPGRTADQVAARFGYTSGSALAGALRRYTGLTLAQARERGAAKVLDILVRRLRDTVVVPSDLGARSGTARDSAAHRSRRDDSIRNS